MDQNENQIRDRIAEKLCLKQSKNTVSRLSNYELFAAFVVKQPKRRGALVSKQTMKTLCAMIIPRKVGIAVTHSGEIHVFDNSENPEDRLDFVLNDHKHPIDIHHMTEDSSILMVIQRYGENGKKMSFYDMVNMKFLYTMNDVTINKLRFSRKGNYFVYLDPNNNSAVFDLKNRRNVKGSVTPHDKQQNMIYFAMLVHETETGNVLDIRGNYNYLNVTTTNPANGDSVCRGFKVGISNHTHIAQMAISDDGKYLVLLTRCGAFWELLKIDITVETVVQTFNTVDANLRNADYALHDLNLANNSEIILMAHQSMCNNMLALVCYDFQTGCIVKNFDFKPRQHLLHVVNNRTNVVIKQVLILNNATQDDYNFLIFYTLGCDETIVEDFLLLPSHLKNATYVFERL
jgi:hypothetical protein